MMDLSRQSPSKASFFRTGVALAFFLCLTPACKREEIRVYTVPKEKPLQVASTEPEEHPSGSPHIHYKTPAGWTEEQPGGMRVARFSVPAKQGPAIDVSVIPLPGITASKVDIVNLWREQIRLAPVQESDLAAAIEKVKIGGDEGEMFDMVSTDAMIEDMHKARILVAMLKEGQATWFFKMTGEDESVRAQKPEFIEFLNSVTIDYSSHAEPAPRVTSGGPARPAWEIPPSWKEVPPTQMLLAKFVTPDPKQPKVEVTVSVLAGDGGGLLPNINRWRRQLKLEPIEDGALGQLTQPLDATGGKGVLVEFKGENTNGQPTQLIGAILPSSEKTWFYKLTGDPQVAQQEKNAFVQFVQTAKYANAP